MNYLEQDRVQPMSGSESPMMAGETLNRGMMVNVLYENLFAQEGSIDYIKTYSGIGILLEWKVNDVDIWLDVLCGDHIITMPMHYGNEMGTPTTLIPIR